MEENRLKQRLVGAMVLVALAVIFIPMLLSGSQEMNMPEFGSNVPERSAEIMSIKHIEIKDSQAELHAVNPKRIPIAEGMPEPKMVKENFPSAAVKAVVVLDAKEKKQIKNKNVWAVQVGSFNNRKNALGLKDKLRKKKIHAFVERIIKNNKAIYRVRVGPEISRKKAETLKKKLKAQFQLSGLIVKHP